MSYVWKAFWSLVALPFGLMFCLLAFIAGGPAEFNRNWKIIIGG